MDVVDRAGFGAWFTQASDRWLATDPSRSLSALADVLDVDRSAVSHWRSGRMVPDAVRGTLPRLCRTLGLEPEEARRAYELAGIDVSPVIEAAAP